MHIETAYRLKIDILGIKAGTIFIQHPRAINRFYPEFSYENGELIHDLHTYGLISCDVANTQWFEPVMRRVIPEAKEWVLLQDLPVEKAGTRIIIKDNDYVVKETGASFPYSPLVNDKWFKVAEEEPKSWWENALNQVFEQQKEYTESDLYTAFNTGINFLNSSEPSTKVWKSFLRNLKIMKNAIKKL